MALKFLMISRLLYDKGYSQYVMAAKKIKQENPYITFQLLGSLDLEYPNHVSKDELYADINSGTIEYLGYIPNVTSIIKNADCIVLPSYYNEGLSRVLMEALAMRKVIITSNIPGCKETVEDGINGFLCQPCDVQSLFEAMKRVIMLSEEERIVMGNHGRKKAEDEFDINKVISAYHQITDEYCH